jgi:hypothetical protein
MHGNPGQLAYLWVYQNADGLCVPAAIADVVAEARGESSSSTLFPQVVSQAASAGYLHQDSSGNYTGMYMSDGATLTISLGVPATLTNSTSADPMVPVENALDRGQGVVASVDADELPLWEQTDQPGDNPNHALVVTGVDTGAGLVYLNDSGHPQGQEEILTIAQFEEAWNDSNYEMIVTGTGAGS